MRVKISIQYDGTNFNGWQKQPKGNTIQDILENALENVLNQKISIFASGRTDAGVHAICQIAHFDIESKIPLYSIQKMVNKLLPNQIRIIEIVEVDKDFHSRYDVVCKQYMYKFYTGNVELPLYINRELFVSFTLDFEAMVEAAKIFVGTHDFKNFKKVDKKDDTVRTIFDIEIKKDDNHYACVISGSGFLHNMVRNIIGTLLMVGRGKVYAQDVQKLLDSEKKSPLIKNVSPCGLYLNKVEYKK